MTSNPLASGAGDPGPADPVRAQRIARADCYYAEDLADQQGWYSDKASGNKEWALRLSLVIILCGALTTFLQIFEAALWVRIASGVLGISVALIQGAQRIWKFDETWHAYRAAAERMKRERRLYINGAGPYAAIASEEEAYRAFVGAVEQILAEEQQIYWQDRGIPLPTEPRPDPVPASAQATDQARPPASPATTGGA